MNAAGEEGQTKPSHDVPCEFCGEMSNRLGTRTDLEIFYEDYTFAGYPTFCSWEHAAEWFARPRPDFTSWDKSADRRDEFPYGGLVFVLGVVGLSIYGLVTLVARLV